MRTEIIELEDTEKWNQCIRSFQNYDVFYLNEYNRAFKNEEGGRPFLFYCEDGKNRTASVAVKRDISELSIFNGSLDKNKIWDLSSPYGYGGFVTDGTLTEGMLDAYDACCREQGIVSEFVRFQLFYGYEELFRGKTESHSGNVVRSLWEPMEEIEKNFEYKVRKNYKKAVKSGLVVRAEETEDSLDDFLRIYYGTMERNKAQNRFYFSRRFFEILGEMDKHFCYFYVLLDGQVISTELVLCGSECVYSFLGGTDEAYFALRPNDFLKVEIIKWAKKKGYKYFVLGGGYGSDDGIFQYKKSFAPEGIMPFYIGKRIFDREKYEELVSMRKEKEPEEKGDSFFPEYRKAGD